MVGFCDSSQMESDCSPGERGGEKLIQERFLCTVMSTVPEELGGLWRARRLWSPPGPTALVFFIGRISQGALGVTQRLMGERRWRVGAWVWQTFCQVLGVM